MKLDTEAHLNAVTRSVKPSEYNGGPARTVTLERPFDTPAQDLWGAVTNPERLARWFTPVSGDLRQGGHYKLEGNAGGTITDCDPPRFLAVTWEFGNGVSQVEVTITPGASDTASLKLSHVCPFDEFWQQFGPGAPGVGWDLGMLGLAIHLSDDAPDRLDEEAFAASPEGPAFINGSSEAWAVPPSTPAKTRRRRTPRPHARPRSIRAPATKPQADSSAAIPEPASLLSPRCLVLDTGRR